MSGIQPQWSDIIQRAIASALADLITIEGGTVVSYDRDARTADVRLIADRTLPRADGSTVPEARPVLADVPVCFAIGASNVFVWEPQAGDGVLVVATTHSLRDWFATARMGPPSDTRRMHLAHALAIPILSRATLTPDPDHAMLLGAATMLKIVAPEVRIGAVDASDFAALSSKVDDNFNRIAGWLSGAAVSGGTPASWVATPNDGGAALQAFVNQQLGRTQPAPDGAPVPVACSKVKIT